VSTDTNQLETWALQRVITSAIALADSGRYHDFTDIDYALRFEHGWIEARALIDDGKMRALLNDRCASAQACATAQVAASLAAASASEPVTVAKPSLLRFAFGLRAVWRARAVKSAGAADLGSAAV